MANYYYQALDSQQQLVAGELEAENVQQAIEVLSTRGLTVQSIGQQSPREWAPSTEAIKSDPQRSAVDVERDVLRSHLERVRLDAAAIVPALLAYAEEMPRGRRRQELVKLSRVLQRGDIVEAEHTFRTLPEYWISLLSAAASSRDPGRLLRGFLEESRQADELRRQWWLALAYPLAVACLATVVLTAISVLIIPGFREVFLDFDLELPAFTLLILKISHWINSGWIVVVVGVLVATGVLAAYAGRSLPSSIFGWLADRLGVPFGRSTAIARFTRFLADLLEAGLSIPDALRIAAISSRRRRLRRVAGRLADQIESGAEVSIEMYEHALTTTALHALHSEMPRASQIRLLKEISQSYAERARARLSWTRGVLEPIAIIVIGLAVGAVVIALFLPLVRLVEGLS